MTLRPDLNSIAKLIPKEQKVLDVGCDDGALLTYLQEEKNIDGRGIELHQEGVSKCVKNGLSVIQGNADSDLKFYPDNAFDYTISSQMIQATQNPKDVLLEMLRISNNAIISIPNFGNWHNRIYLLLKGKMPVTKTLSYEWYETPNIHFCTIKDFKTLCKNLNLKIKKTTYLNSKGNRLFILLRLLSANLFSDKAVFLLTK